LLFNVIQA